jgi:hypothetical protein
MESYKSKVSAKSKPQLLISEKLDLINMLSTRDYNF